MKKNTFWIALVLIILSIFFLKVAFTKSKDKDKKKEKVQKKIEAFVVKPSLLIDEIFVSGSLQAYDEVELKNEIGGRVVRINLPEGKFVKKGTLLVKLFDEDLQANLKKLEAQLALQQDIFKRQTELYQANGISKNDYERTILEVNSIKSDIEVQKAMIRKTEVLAPFDGVIGLRNVSVGAIVTPSTLLATLRTENKLKLDFYVPEKYGAEIHAGIKIDFTIYEGNKNYSAVVLATERGIEDATRNLKVRAIVNSSSPELIPGAFATIHLRLGENKNALMIPTEAIIPQEENKTLIIARKGKAHSVSVKTGIRKSSKIEIKEGIHTGDTIITSGILFLKENDVLHYSSIK
jgi:membrane fusion protein (multidrug efflux system)